MYFCCGWAKSVLLCTRLEPTATKFVKNNCRRHSAMVFSAPDLQKRRRCLTHKHLSCVIPYLHLLLTAEICKMIQQFGTNFQASGCGKPVETKQLMDYSLYKVQSYIPQDFYCTAEQPQLLTVHHTG